MAMKPKKPSPPPPGQNVVTGQSSASPATKSLAKRETTDRAKPTSAYPTRPSAKEKL